MAKVLVVDDHPANRDLVVTVLGYRGHDILEAGDGAEALAAARSERPDLVITDLLMPVMDGYELVRELRADAELASTPVVFYTANYLQDEVRPIAVAAGVRHILSKPVEPQRLLAVVDDALADATGRPQPSEVPGDFDRAHLRALSAKLVDKVRELETTEQALRDSEVRFRALAESSPVGIFSLEHGVVSYSNPHLRRICGLAADDVAPVWADLLHPDDRERVRGLVDAAVAAGTPFHERLRIVRPTGEERWVDLHGAPVVDAGVTYVGTAEDVTDAVEGQRRHDDLEARLRVSERLESLGQLAAGIAHDFNNLLGAMLNYAGFVASEIHEMRGSNDDKRLVQMQDDVAAISTAASRAAELTRQLLIFGRREIIRPEVLDLNDVVAAVERLLTRTIGEHIRLESRLEPALWSVTADRSRLEQVVLNLVVNSRDAIDDTGMVAITTDNIELDEESARLHATAQPGRYARLTVADDGAGMSPETAARAFEPFFTTKPKGEGTGLGLATVYGIVNQLGGHVGIYSEPGRGTTIRVYLPAADHAPQETSEAVDAPRLGRGEHILVIEDDDDMRAVTTRILRTSGYQVTAFSGGRAALEILQDEANRVDLILTDVVMPEMSGREVAERASEMRPGVRVLFMSGYAEGIVSAHGTLPAGVDLIEKPFTQASLLHGVGRALQVESGDVGAS